MAEACPSVILDNVLKQLESPIFHKIKLNCPLHIQLNEIRSKLELIRDVLDDAELMVVLFPEFVRQWVCDLQRVLFEFDDILDEALTRSMPTSGCLVEKVRLRLYCLSFDLKVAHKMKKINNRLTSIVEECYKCNLIVEPTSNHNEKPVARKGILRYDPEYVRDDEFYMIGRDDDKEEVIQMLFNEEVDEPDVWITGYAGVGKTVLCRSIYNDEAVRNHFEICLWVGYDLSPIELWKKIITAFPGAVDEVQTPHSEADIELELKDKVTNLIGERKTLIVLDHFRPYTKYGFLNPDQPELFLDIKALTVGSNKGSKILLSVLTNLYKPPLTGDWPSGKEITCDMSEEHCWYIFEKTAFVPGHGSRANQVPPEWMIDLGRHIVSKCESHPALLRGIGTLLFGKEDRATWEQFARDYNFNDRIHHYREYSGIYNFLSKCQHNIGYLSLLSKSTFEYEALIQQYAAHGFTKLSDTMQLFFSERFLPQFQEEEDNWDTRDYTGGYRVMDKSRIFQLAGQESAYLEWTGTYLSEAARHVSILRPSPSMDQQQQFGKLPGCLIEDVIHRRSLLFCGNKSFPLKMSVHTLDILVSNLRYLRVLDLQDLALQELPTSVCKLIHLRYLDLSRNNFKLLPKSICRLKNLVTLKLNYCDKLIILPQDIYKLSHLKHLEINMCMDLTRMPSTIARLTSLERLDRFIVSPHSGGLAYLAQLHNLKGHISIELPRRWEKSKVDAEQANMENKRRLTSLELKWQGVDNGIEENDDDHVLEKLKPSSGTENLYILNFGGKTVPNWITYLGMENCLTEITISHCKRCQILPPLHVIPNLKFLTLTSMNIEYMQDIDSLLCNVRSGNRSSDSPCVVSTLDSNVFFPSLIELKIGGMPRLKGWWDLSSIGFSTIADGLPRFQTINIVEIWNCPCLVMLPPFSGIRNEIVLQDVSNKMLQSIDCMEIRTVEIISIQDMVSLPRRLLIKEISNLRIESCNSLQTLWVDDVKVTGVFLFVRGLSITNCPALKYLSSNLRQLIHLQELTLSKCNEELDCLYKDDNDGMPWKALQQLDYLTIEGFQNLAAFPKGLRQLHELDYLEIVDCKALRWEFGSLPRSRFLFVRSCPHFSTRIEELETEHENVEVLE